jgi:uncharacterized protein (DUF58 family)
MGNIEEPTILGPELMGKVRQIQIRTHRLVNTALAGGYRSTFRGQGVEFEEVRPYQIGDDVRSIDWNVTARTGEPYIKTYSEERELTIHLIVDTSLSMDFGSREWTKREIAAQFGALISFVAIRQQDRVGLSCFGEEPGLHLPAKKGGNHILRVVREVLAAPPTAGGSDLGAILSELVRVLRRRSVVFLVSDFLEQSARRRAGAPGLDDFWGDTLARLNRRHDVIAVRVTDPLEEGLVRAGVIPVSEIETGRALEIDTRSREVDAGWRREAARRRAELLAVLSRARVDLIELSTVADVADPVRAFFRTRQKRYGRDG